MHCYHANKKAAIYNNDDPSATDQSSAHETDINVIVGKYGITGRVPAMKGTPIAGDFTGLPGDLRDMIETSRTVKHKRDSLPKELRDLPVEELLSLTPDKLNAILAPAQPNKQEDIK
jgi:hypothetical protein